MKPTPEEVSVATLRRLYEPPGPVVSVYLDLGEVRRARSAAGLELRWRALADELTRLGADAETVDAAGRRVLEAQPGPQVLTVHASAGSILLASRLPECDQDDLAYFGALPYGMPLLRWLQGWQPRVEATTDRAGTSIVAVSRPGTTPVATMVAGPDDEIERNAPGGWAQARYQRRAEDSWEHNATAAAVAVARAVAAVNATLLVLGGDVRAVELLEERLPTWVRQQARIRHVPGSRSPDGSQVVREGAIATAAREAAAERSRALLKRLNEGRGSAGQTVDGAQATVAALALGGVATLIVRHDPQDERVAWFGTRPTQVALRPDDPAVAGIEPSAGRLVDVLTRCALLTRAEVHVLDVNEPEGPAEGVGALRRYR